MSAEEELDAMIAPYMPGAQSEVDQWAAWVRDTMAGDPNSMAVALSVAKMISAQHRDAALAGRILITAGSSIRVASHMLAEMGHPITTEGMANLVAMAGIILADQKAAS